MSTDGESIEPIDQEQSCIASSYPKRNKSSFPIRSQSRFQSLSRQAQCLGITFKVVHSHKSYQPCFLHTWMSLFSYNTQLKLFLSYTSYTNIKEPQNNIRILHTRIPKSNAWKCTSFFQVFVSLLLRCEAIKAVSVTRVKIPANE